MRIHWARIALVVVVLLVGRLAEAQIDQQNSSIHYQTPRDPEAGLPVYKRTTMPPAPIPYRSHDGYLPPNRRLELEPTPGPLAFATVIPSTFPPSKPGLTPVVFNGGQGGLIAEHILRFWTLAQTGAPVEMRGGCWSACTLITAYVPKDRLCFAPGAFLAFHSALTADRQAHPYATAGMYLSYPAEIRQWIDDRGGYQKLTIESFWTMYDRDLWAIGYQRCK